MMLQQMYDDCLVAEADGRIDAFLANIADVCYFKIPEEFEWLEYLCRKFIMQDVRYVQNQSLAQNLSADSLII